MHALRSLFCGLIALSSPLVLKAAPPNALTEPAKANQAQFDEHIVKRGETLWSVAQKYNTSVGEVMDYNNLSSHELKNGAKLRIPRRGQVDPRKVRQHIHVVGEDDTFWSIADGYGITLEALSDANPNVNPKRVHAGMELIIPAEETRDTPLVPKKKTEVGKGAIAHTVATGETFFSISKLYKIPVEAIMKANPTVSANRIRTGMRLVIPPRAGAATSTAAPRQTERPTAPRSNVAQPTPIPPPPPAVAAAAPAPKAAGQARLHTVRQGESIYSIARKYNVSPDALQKHNKRQGREFLQIGDVLAIPARPTSSNTATVTAASNAPVAAPKRDVPPPPAAASPKRPTPAPTPSAPEKEDQPAFAYTVTKGEDENSICEVYNITKEELFRRNRLPANTRLRPGDEIMIPRSRR